MINRRATLRSAAATAFLAACGKKSAPPPDAFAGFVADTTGDLIADSPELATQAGLTSVEAGSFFADRLDGRSADAVELRRSAALRRWAQLRAVDRNTLGDAARETYDVLAAQFGAAADGAAFSYGRFHPLTGFSPYVLNQLDSAFITLPDFLQTQHRVATFDDAETYLKRLSRMASALDQETARAREDAAAGVVPPTVVIDRASALIAAHLQTPPADFGVVTSFRMSLEAISGALPLDPLATTDTPSQARARAMVRKAEAIAASQIVPAYRRAWYALAEMRSRSGSEPGVWRLPNGEAYYRAALAFQTSTALAPETVHAIGLRRVHALSAEMDMMLRSQGMTAGGVGERMALLNTDPRFVYPATPEGHARLLADLRGWERRIRERLGDWFRTPAPKAPLEIRTTQNGQPGAYYQPPSLDGARPGAFFVNLRDIGAQARFDLPTLVHHEAVPGHHFQIAMAQAQSGLPLLRRLMTFNGFAEGWALYAEQLADEMGLYEGDPHARLGYLRWQTWRAARLVVDTGIHFKRWSREQAVAYLTTVTGDSAQTIAHEVDRYIANPGQACGYELGRMEIVRLRDKARGALGARFNIRDFHHAILSHGDAPLSLLSTIVDAFVADAKGGV